MSRSIVLIAVAFMCLAIIFAEPKSHYEYKLVYNYDEFTVVILDSDGQKLGVYSTTVPARKPSYWPNSGWVTKVVINPGWRPTIGTRKYYEKKEGRPLPEYLPPGNERNAMGNYKMYFAFDEPVGMPIRGHGSNRPEQIRMRISRGCIRTLNQDGIEILNILAGRDLSVDFASGETKTIAIAKTRVVLE